eukprot:TCONS_00061828-protein
MAKITDEELAHVLERSVEPHARRILQDGFPRQNSRVALDAFDRHKVQVFKIPARSPDLNPLRIRSIPSRRDFDNKPWIAKVNMKSLNNSPKELSKPFSSIFLTGRHRQNYGHHEQVS